MGVQFPLPAPHSTPILTLLARPVKDFVDRQPDRGLFVGGGLAVAGLGTAFADGFVTGDHALTKVVMPLQAPRQTTRHESQDIV